MKFVQIAVAASRYWEGSECLQHSHSWLKMGTSPPKPPISLRWEGSEEQAEITARGSSKPHGQPSHMLLGKGSLFASWEMDAPSSSSSWCWISA